MRNLKAHTYFFMSLFIQFHSSNCCIGIDNPVVTHEPTLTAVPQQRDTRAQVEETRQETREETGEETGEKTAVATKVDEDTETADKTTSENTGTPDQSTDKETASTCDTTCVTGEWSQWTECTKQCGGGTRARTRTNTKPACAGAESSCPTTNDETQACNTNVCPAACGQLVTLVTPSTAQIVYTPDNTAPHDSGTTATVSCPDSTHVLIKTDSTGQSAPGVGCGVDDPNTPNDETSATRVSTCTDGSWTGDNVALLMPYTCVPTTTEPGCPVVSGAGEPPKTLRFYVNDKIRCYTPGGNVVVEKNSKTEICCTPTKTWFGDQYRLANLANTDLRYDIGGSKVKRDLGNCQDFQCKAGTGAGEDIDSWKHINKAGEESFPIRTAIEWVCRPVGCLIFDITQIAQLSCPECTTWTNKYTSSVTGGVYVPVGTRVSVSCQSGTISPTGVTALTCTFPGTTNVAGSWNTGSTFIDPRTSLKCL